MQQGLLENIVSELNARLAGGVISKIQQSDEKNILLKVFARTGQARLIISAHKRLSRLHLTEREFENPAAPLRFCAFLRSRIEGAVVAGFTHRPGENIVELGLKKGGSAFTLVAELTGKSSNIILVDSNGICLDALRYFSPEDSPRVVVPGAALTPLPPLRHVAAPAEKGGMPERKDDETWNSAADRYFSSLMDEDELLSQKNALKKTIAEAGKKLKKKLENLNNDQERASANLSCYRLGELLKQNTGGIKRGAREFIADDFTKVPPEKVNIPLDERLDQRENIERYFKRAKKAKTALKMLETSVPAVMEAIKRIDALQSQWLSVNDMEGASKLKQGLVKAGHIKTRPRDGAKKEPAGEPIRRFLSTEGFEILCGRSGRGNDLILRKYAADDDIWFHAHNCPGSHCLIRVAGRKGEVTEKTITEAAAISAHYSKLSSSTKVEVLYTDAGNVKKPKGAKPGTVAVKTFKTILVEPGVVKSPPPEKASL
ncbi:MAG: NFACT family protein [Deltaproteobacteria bacterium]